MKKSMFVPLFGLGVMAVTVITYVVMFGGSLWGAIHFVTLLAVILAEAVTTAYAFFANGSPRKVGAAIVSGMMIPLSIILSFLYIFSFPTGYIAYLGWYFLATVVINGICLILIFFDSQKSKENDRLQEAKASMLQLRKQVKCIGLLPSAAPYSDRLRTLEEKLHFTNDSIIHPEDAQIQALLVQFQESISGSSADSSQLLEQLELLVSQRNILSSP